MMMTERQADLLIDEVQRMHTTFQGIAKHLDDGLTLNVVELKISLHSNVQDAIKDIHHALETLQPMADSIQHMAASLETITTTFKAVTEGINGAALHVTTD